MTDDPFARNCNRFAWEYALRRLRAAAYTVPLRRPAEATSDAG